MIQTVNLHDFRQAFHNMGRGEQFSYEALELIYDYFEEVDPEFDLDVIAICCDFDELTTEEIIRQYGIDCDDIEDDELDEHVSDYLQNNTSLVGQTSSGFVFQSF
jgi:hypothetical protein